jgi:hypothetical protein
VTRTVAFLCGCVFLLADIVNAQTSHTAKLMREKLLHSQRILAALTTSDYAVLQRETRALTRVTQSPDWTELMTGSLGPYTKGFVKALGDLSEAAERRDYDAAGASYTAVTAACFGCHKHVMRSRGARAP